MSRRRVVVLLILTSLLLITLDRRGNNVVIDKARQAFSVIIRPFDIAANAVSKPVANAWYGITHYQDVKTENQALHDQIEHQKGAEIEAKTAINIANDLLKLNRLTSVRNIKGVAAQVIGEAPSNFQNTIEVTVGSRDGVAVGMPVTDGAGLIGKVTKVNPDSSFVMLITDPQFAVQAQVLSRVDETDASSTTSSTTFGTTPSGRSLGPTTSTSTTTTTTTTTPVSTTTTTIPRVGATAGGTTTSSTSTTSTTLPSFKVRRETGDITGQGADRPLLFSLIDDTALTNVKIGDIVETAGGTKSLAPQSIPIGTITAVTRRLGSRSPIVEVEPNASLTQLNFVSVVLFVPNQAAI
ncbi:MAG: rod shape-determining protein MreC [Ilumatobacteraceae bacterium]|nr:rod shape-determining protein MreC [Ilumatobacteraceae bacterium]